MRLPSAYALTATLAFAPLAFAAYDSAIVGTWSTKSKKTLTGPGFYDPATETMFEPSLTGFSYSFTADGYYEEAYYRAISNPVDPSCPSGIMQWQHGSYVINADGSMILNPIAVDGRQLMSTPCNEDNAIYTRYNQTETIKSYVQYTDPYHNIPRLNMYKFDGSPMNAMYLVYSPPEMLPTTTLNPTNSATSGATSSSTSSSKLKRALGTKGREVPVNWKSNTRKGSMDVTNPDHWWWVGLTMTGIGGLLYFGPRRMGLSG